MFNRINSVVWIAFLILILGICVCIEKSGERKAPVLTQAELPAGDAPTAGRQATITFVTPIEQGAGLDIGFAPLDGDGSPDAGGQATITLVTPMEQGAGFDGDFVLIDGAEAPDAWGQTTITPVTPVDHISGYIEGFVPADPGEGIDAGRQGAIIPADPVDHHADYVESFVSQDKAPPEINHPFYLEEDADWHELSLNLADGLLDLEEELGNIDYSDDYHDERVGIRRRNHFLRFSKIN